jgi:MFS family permease
MALGIALAGWAADHLGAVCVLLFGCALAVASGLALAPLLGSGKLGGAFAFLALSLFAMGFVYGPLGGWLTGLYPARVRDIATSLDLNLGGIIGGVFTPAIAQLLADTGGLGHVGVYLIGAAVLSVAGILATGEGGN